ncbi:diguanylate cyclase (GGDEF)-like protein [Hydrogenivirga caldilitoris]|uniref:diguanylate cyclase n=1 Tax=Hydrogenivirga caldilitoris TaxID=246264 RepID=A0A497XNT8_9AQUI|nr:diguanylate cyclase [Hydrogenivirga caldilitoris]RLJ69800.1 diguanylate cyclase (GGDEF)-like protein [Hydrogenivirga caldilitoris]
MTLRKKVFLFTVTAFTLTTALVTYHQFELYRELLKKEKESFCEKSTFEFNKLVEFHKRVANSVSSYIARDSDVRKLFESGDKEGLYLKLKPLYEEVSRENLIREISFFKLPAVNFLNMRNPRESGRDVTGIRRDVVESGKNCITTKSIIICTNYVGIRAVNPITKDGKAIGLVSVGIDMEDFLRYYSSITGTGCGLAIKDEALKRSLLKESYMAYTSKTVRKEEYLVSLQGGTKDLVGALEFSGKSLKVKVEDKPFFLCNVPIEDFSEREIGYFFTYKDVSSLSANLALDSLKSLLGSYIPLLVAIFIGSVLSLGRVSAKVEKLYALTELIKKRKFHELPKTPSLGRDEFGAIESAILDMAKEIEKYINVLSKEIEVYTGKAYMDNITGVFNRRAFDEFGKEVIDRFLALGKPVSVLMIDIDDFKKINDNYGHQVGDRVLAELGRLIKETLRDSDMVFRYGGEEFLAILPSTPLSGSLRAAENIRKRIELHRFSAGEETIRLTVSIGAAQGQGEDKDAEDVILRADKALYIAKKTGKNRVAREI